MRLLAAATLLIIVLASGLVIGGAAWVLQSSERSVALARWAVAQFTNLRLELVSPQVSVDKGELRAGQLLLYPQHHPELPLLVIHDLEASFRPRDLLRRQLRRARVSAGNLTVYVGPGDPGQKPSPASWMRFLRWLPGQLEVASVHLLQHDVELLVFPLQQLSGQLQDENSYRLHAVGDLQGEPLDTTIHLYAMRSERGLRGIQLRADLHATRSARVAVLEGELLGGTERFSYDFSLNAALPDIHLLAGRGAELSGLAGALQMRGRIRGDLDQFRLSDADFGLFNAPDYEFLAHGEFDYRGPDDNLLQVQASGQIQELALLLDWFDVDLSGLGSARAELDIQGPLASLAVPSFTLNTHHGAGLDLTLQGSLGPGALNAEGAQQRDNEVRVRAAGPELSVLEPWLGDNIPDRTGPWEVTALATGRRDQVTLANISGRIGEPGGTVLNASGRIEQIDTTAPFSPASVQGVNLQLTGTAETLERINRWYPTGLDNAHRLTADADLTGSGDALQLENLRANLEGSDLTVALTGAQGLISSPQWALSRFNGDLAASISDTSALSQYFSASVPVLGAASATAQLERVAGTFRLTNVQGEINSEQVQLSLSGELPNLRTLEATRLDVVFSRLDMRNLIHSLVDGFTYPQPLGALAGQLALQRTAGEWHMPQISVASSGTPAIKLQVDGAMRDLAGAPSGGGSVELAITDRELLKVMSGRELPTLQASFSTQASAGKLDFNGSATLASTTLALQGKLRHHNQEVQGLVLELSSPAVVLADLGLQSDPGQAASAQPAPPDRNEQATPFSLEELIGSLPRYPLDLQLHLGSVRGENIDLEGIDLAIEGSERRYLLRQLDLRGDESRLELAGVIDLAAQPPGISLGGQAQALDMYHVVRDLGLQLDVAGILNLRGGISARGNHRAEWLGSLDGNVSLALEDVEIEGAAYDLLATDLLAWLYSGAALEKSTHVDCTMASFSLRSGVAKSENLFAESPRMVATGKGTFDLVRETLDVRITPLSKNRLLQIPSSITLTGKLRKPRTWVSPITATVDASAKAMTLIPALTLKLLGLRRDDDKPMRPCEALPPA
ncbi:AsmA family protein [Parahaliea maris]|uniref:AsmA family protein n=1 Tax=Parahaliea maris TaxID=2716870 RepID=A0A5C8ZYZ3_9GAMM|nr:AsmA-like C-terminal region-containing protein [Parahaliea maris]TXS93029.1 AsmA family protein [Parahaliea maris]